MKMTGLFKKFTGLFWGIFLSAVLLCLKSSYAETFESLITDYQELKTQIASSQTLQNDLNSKLHVASTRINTLKKDLRNSSSLLKQYKLDTLMKEAQNLANKIVSANKSQMQLQNQLQALQAKLVERLDQQIEADQIKIKDRSLDIIERKATYLAMMSHMEQRESYLPQERQGPSKWVMSTPSKLGDPLEHKEILKTLKRDIKTEMNALENQMAAVQKQGFVRSELESFLEEEAFFSETGFVRSGLAKKAVKDEKLTKTTATTPAAATTPTASATPVTTDSSSTNAAAFDTTTPTVAAAEKPVDMSNSISTLSVNPEKTVSVVATPVINTPIGTPDLSKTIEIAAPPKVSEMKTFPVVSPAQKVESRDRAATLSQDLSRNSSRKKSATLSTVSSDSKLKSLQERLDYLKRFLQDLESDQEQSLPSVTHSK